MTKQTMNAEGILNEALVNLAIDLSTPAILELMEVKEPLTVWGPKFIVVTVIHHSLNNPIVREIGNRHGWDKEWGNIDTFRHISDWKANTAIIEGMPTSKLVLQCPWELVASDYLYPGGVVAEQLGVGGSGLLGFADEGAANTVLSWIKALSKLKYSQLREQGIGQLIKTK